MKKNMKRIIVMFFVIALSMTQFTSIQAATKQVTIHYNRSDKQYEGWNLWVWPEGGDGQEYEFTQEDEFGKIATIELESDGDVGFIVKKVEGDNIWADKDVADDRYITEFNDQGQAEIWLMSGDGDISYTELDGTIEPKFKDLQITDMRVIKLVTTTSFTQADANSIQVEGYEIEKIVAGTPTTASIYLKEDVDLTKAVNVTFGEFGTSMARMGQVLHSKSFNDLYYYDGPLGFEYTTDSTTFRVWAPTALKVDLKLEGQLYPMTKVDKGVWQHEVSGDLLNQKYTYELEFLDGTKTSTSDPYSIAVTANSQESVIVTQELLRPDNWDPTKRMPAFSGRSNALIYEAHIRDMTINPDNGIEHKGKFLGLTEKGTKTTQGNPSGLDYIKSLGVTHVQFLPMYDFASIDETVDLGYGKVYNWGYDPLNYNVPEGTYSTDPLDPVVRVKEMKQMIQALHDEGLYVIMDVVYNHVADVNKSSFHKTVPGYFFRYDNNGKLKNGTGVGNETASEQPMFRRYMIESTKYWINEFNLDGFRFDLMGIHDIETMNQIRVALDEIDASIIILGEGWDMGTMASNLKANQKNADQLPGISYFNDSFRDGVKGSVFNAAEPGFVNGDQNKSKLVYNNLIGGQNLDPSQGKYQSANQVVQYVEAHDNLTLYDKLSATNSVDDDVTREKRHNLATTMTMLSLGMPFIHAGQEILRTKGGDHNSYISPDDVNVFDYDRAAQYPNSLQLFKDLVQIRKDYPLLRMFDYQEISQHSNLVLAEGQLIVYELFNEDQKMLIAFNGSNESVKVATPDEDSTIILLGQDTTHKEVTQQELTLDALSALVVVSGQLSTSTTSNTNWFLYLGLALILLIIGIILMKRRRV